MNELSLEQQVGQLFMVVIDEKIAARYESYIRSGRLGGGLLRWDAFNGGEARRFTASLQDWARTSGTGLPFFVAVDHEGGPLFTQRTLGATLFPGNMALGAAGSVELARRAAAASARELAPLGVHIDFAPVLDVNSNPDNPIIGLRSFGEDPAAAAALGAAAVRGYLAGGVLPVAKHFPGHGDTSVDSHSALPSIERSRAQWADIELPPFQAAIAAGVPMIMPAHLRAPALGSPFLPVTLSSAVLQGVLRRELGFKGVIVSDSLDMAAISKGQGAAESAIRAFLAGCDLLLLGKADFPKVYSAFLRAVRSGRVPVKRVRAAARRIAEAKTAPALGRGASGVEGGKKTAHVSLARRIAESSVTLLRNEGSVIPLAPGSRETLLAVVFRSPRFAGEAADFAADLARRHPQARTVFLPPHPKKADAAKAAAAARRADVLIIGTCHWGAKQYRKQADLVRRMLKLGKPAVLVSLMNPYDVRFYPQAKAVLCTYGMTRASLRAAVRVLFGELRPRGRLPVTILPRYHIGAGL